MQKKESDKFVETNVLEGMSSISALIRTMSTDECSNDRRIVRILIDESKRRSKYREIKFLSSRSNEFGYELEFVSSDAIESVTSGQTHGGIVAECTARTIPILNKTSVYAGCIKKNGVYFMLDGVEDPYNFGYAVRSLYASGADGIILPPRNWMSVAGVVARASAGTSELMNMFVCDHLEAVDIFKSIGYTVICAGIRDSVSIFETELKKPLLVILGGEKRGISASVLEKADKIVRIDYGAEFNGSLSMAASAAVFGFEIFRMTRK